MAKHTNHGKPWNADSNDELIQLVARRLSFIDIANHMGRTVGAVITQASRLNLVMIVNNHKTESVEVYFIDGYQSLKYTDIKGK